jgi:serine/threonine protein kinase
MGEVMFCRDLLKLSKEMVVLKTYHDEIIGCSVLRERFIKEATAWLKLGVGNPYLLGFEGIIMIENKPYIQMQYCAGGNLRMKLEQGPIPLKEAVYYGTQLLLGLWSIDDMNGIIHRDIKPENILFDNEDTLKIADFGIVKIMQEVESSLRPDNNLYSTKTKYGSFVGTLPYAAPEQLIYESKIDSGVDMWSFAVVLFEMLTGHQPFVGEDPDALIEAILYKKPLDYEKIIQKLPTELTNIITRCLEKDRRKRYSTFKDIIFYWDLIIKLKNSPRRPGLFKKDGRITIQNEHIDHCWYMEFFPDRKPSDLDKVSFNVRVLAGLDEAEGYNRLGEYEKVLIACDKVLGNSVDPHSNISLYLCGKLPDNIRYEYSEKDKDSTKMYAVPSEKMVWRALWLKMKAYVDIIEEREKGKSYESYISELLAYCDLVEKSTVNEKELMIMCAEGYCLGAQYTKAERVLLLLLESDSEDVHVLSLLQSVAQRSGDVAKKSGIGKLLIERLKGKADFASQFYCARASALMGDWASCVFFASRAYLKNPNDIENLFFLSSGLINLKNYEDAYKYYREMMKVDPTSFRTIYLRNIFENK